MIKLGTNRLFVGREDALRRLGDVFDEARSARGSVVVLTGEPGLGKTRLLTAAAERASTSGFCVGSSTNYEYARSPFAPLMEALRALLVGRESALPRKPADREALLAFFGEAGNGVAPLADKRRLFVVIAETLTRVAGDRPWLMVLDDAQWSDPETLEFVSYLAPRIREIAGCLIIAYRSEPHGEGNPDGLAPHAPNVERIALNRLTAGESRVFIAAIQPTAQRLSQNVVDDIAMRAKATRSSSKS